MADPTLEPPVVAVPGRLGRRLRLGPFDSGRDAAKFLVYAACGAAFVPVGMPWLAVPFVVGGLAITLWKPDGQAVDRRLWVIGRYALRRAHRSSTMTGAPWPPGDRSSAVRLPDGGWVAVLRTGGTPVAFTPPDDLVRQFDSYREFLRGVDGELSILATSAGVHRPSVRPIAAATSAAEQRPLDGYRELVDLLARRRAVRQVYVAVRGRASGADGRLRLETTASGAAERLAAVGLRVDRLHGRALGAAVGRLGLGRGGPRR